MTNNKTYDLSMVRPLDNTPITVTVDANGEIKGITMTRQSKESSPWQPGETEHILNMIDVIEQLSPAVNKHELYTFLEKLDHPDLHGQSECRHKQPKENKVPPLQRTLNDTKVIELSGEHVEEFLRNPRAFIEKAKESNAANSHKNPVLNTSAVEEGINDLVIQAKALGYHLTFDKITPELSLFEQYKAKNVKLQASGVVAVTTELSKEENIELIKDAYGRGVGFSILDIDKVPKDLLALVA
jgi:hypothetical protein